MHKSLPWIYLFFFFVHHPVQGNIYMSYITFSSPSSSSSSPCGNLRAAISVGVFIFPFSLLDTPSDDTQNCRAACVLFFFFIYSPFCLLSHSFFFPTIFLSSGQIRGEFILNLSYTPWLEVCTFFLHLAHKHNTLMVGMAGYLDEVDVLRPSLTYTLSPPIPVLRCFFFATAFLLCCCCNLVFVQMCRVVYSVLSRPFWGLG